MSTKSLIKPGNAFPPLFDDYFKPWNELFTGNKLWDRMATIPSVNISENNDRYSVSLAAPGLKKEDFQIDVDGNLLTISAETEESSESKEDKFTRKEYSYSSFSRSFNLPDDVIQDKIEAKYENGVLKLSIFKKDGGRKTTAMKHIAVK
jgi:HSP20 family protein